MLSHWSLEWMPALHRAGGIWRPHSWWCLLFAGFLWSPTWTSLCQQSTQIRSLIRKSPPPKKKKDWCVCVFNCHIHVSSCHIFPGDILPVMYCMSAQQRLPICILGIYNLRSECHHYYFFVLFCESGDSRVDPVTTFAEKNQVNTCLQAEHNGGSISYKTEKKRGEKSK